MRYLSVFLFGLLLMLAACGGGGAQNQSGPALNDATGASAGRPTLPDPLTALAQLPKDTSITRLDSYRWGYKFRAQLPSLNVSKSGLMAAFSPLAGLPSALAYAGYEFQAPGYDGSPASLQLNWETAPPAGSVYIGLANFQRLRWDWIAADASGLTALGSLQPYLSADQRVLALIMYSGPGPANLQWLQLAANNLPTARLTQVSATELGTVPAQLELSAAKSDAGGDPDGHLSFEWDPEGDGSFDASLSGDSLSFEYSQAGHYEPTVRITDEDGIQALASIEFPVSQRPLAVLNADISDPARGEAITLDASASSDPDGDTLSYSFASTGGFTAPSGDPLLPGQVYSAAGQYTARLTVTDSYGLSSDAELIIHVSDSPQAQLDAPKPWVRNQPITLDAAASSARHSSITNYSWDLDDDGTYETDSGTTPAAAVTFSSTGRHVVGLRVTSSLGTQAEDSAYIDVGLGVGISLEFGDTGYDVSSALIAGNPALCWYNTGEDSLHFVRAEDALGTSWGSVQLLDSRQFAGPGCTLRSVGGRAMIVYGLGGQRAMNFISAVDAEATSWNAPAEIVASGVDSYYGFAFADINGRPAVSCRTSGGLRLFFRALDADGASWPSGTLIDGNPASTAFGGSLAVVGGRPCLAYSGKDHALYFTRANDSDGLNWPAPTLLDSASCNLQGDCLQEIDGRPAVAYLRWGDQDGLVYLLASDPQGSAWNAPAYLDPQASLFGGVQLLKVGGLPWVATRASLNGPAYFAALDAEGSAWPAPEQIEGQVPGQYISLLELSGGQVGSAYDDNPEQVGIPAWEYDHSGDSVKYQLLTP